MPASSEPDPTGSGGVAPSCPEPSFRELIESSSDLISRFDLNHRLVYANPAVRQLPTGYLVGLEAMLRQVAGTAAEQTIEFEMPLGSTSRHFQARFVPEFDTRGAVETVLVVGQDITDLKKAQKGREELEADNARQSAALRRIAAHKSALAAVTTAINEGISLADVLQRTLTMVISIVGGCDGSVFLMDPDGRHLRGAAELSPVGRIGQVIDLEDWPHDKRAVDTGRPVFFTQPETTGLVYDWFRLLGIWGCLATPLTVPGRCIGLVYVDFRAEVSPPQPDDVAFVESFAAQCAQAIDRTRAHEERALLLVREREARQAADEARAVAERNAGQMAALFRTMAEGVTVIDAEGRIVLRNRMAAEITGAPEAKYSQPFSQPTWSFLDLDGNPLPPESYPARRVLRGEAVGQEEYYLLRPDGVRRRVIATAGAVRDDAGAVALAVLTLRDVTALRELEAAKDDYLQVLAHELRNPLAAATGLVQLVARRLGVLGDLRCRQYLEFTEAELGRLNGLITEIITGYRVSGGRLPLDIQPVNLVDVVAQATRPYSFKAHRRHFIIARSPVPEVPVAADAKRIVEVIANLLSNSIKYSRVGSTIWVSIGVEAQDAVVLVEDEGIGIPPEQLDRVFEGFYRATNLTNRQPGGLGLGLYISRDIARRHGGDLVARGRPEGGTAMLLRLPLRPPDPAQQAKELP